MKDISNLITEIGAVNVRHAKVMRELDERTISNEQSQAECAEIIGCHQTKFMHLNNWCAEDRERIRELEKDVIRRDDQIEQILNLITKHRQCLENIVNRLNQLQQGNNTQEWINDSEEEPEIDQDVIIMNERDDRIVVANATYEGEYLYRVYDKDFGSKFVECDKWMPRGEDE